MLLFLAMTLLSNTAWAQRGFMDPVCPFYTKSCAEPPGRDLSYQDPFFYALLILTPLALGFTLFRWKQYRKQLDRPTALPEETDGYKDRLVHALLALGMFFPTWLVYIVAPDIEITRNLIIGLLATLLLLNASYNLRLLHTIYQKRIFYLLPFILLPSAVVATNELSLFFLYLAIFSGIVCVTHATWFFLKNHTHGARILLTLTSLSILTVLFLRSDVGHDFMTSAMHAFPLDYAIALDKTPSPLP